MYITLVFANQPYDENQAGLIFENWSVKRL